MNKELAKDLKIIVGILILAAFLRVWNMNAPFYSDELPWPYAAADHTHAGFNFIITIPGLTNNTFIWTSPPLAPLLYRFFTWSIGVTAFTMRLLPFILGLVNIVLTYVLAKKLFGRKPAVFAALIMALSFWHVLASFLIEHDSSILMFFWLLFFNAYLHYENAANHKQKQWWLITCGIILGLGLLTKMTAGLMLIALGVYLLLRHRSFKEPFFTCIKILSIGISIFLLFPILSFIFNPAYFQETIAHSEVLTLMPSLFSPLRIIIYLLLWATPFLVGTALFSMQFIQKQHVSNSTNYASKEKNSSKNMLWTWMFTIIIFYVFSKYIAAIDRYMAVIIPPLAILGGYALNSLHFSKKEWKKISIISAVFLAVLIGLNFIHSNWITHDTAQYIRNALHFKWNFIFAFHGDAGPAFMTSFMPLGVGLLACSVAFIVCIVAHLIPIRSAKNQLSKNSAKNKQRFMQSMLIICIAVSLGFNLFIVQAFIIKEPYANPGKVTNEMVQYLDMRIASENPHSIYLTNLNIAWYLDQNTKNVSYYAIGDLYTDSNEEANAIQQNIFAEVKQGLHPLVVITDYPKRFSDDNVWKIANICTLEKTFSDKGMTLGYVYRC
jgi:4-amino-4-deoxy-L-arabinose transferase-like glycosyltransferase